MQIPDGNMPERYQRLVIMLFWVPFIGIMYVVSAAAMVYLGRVALGQAEMVPIEDYLPVDASFVGLIVLGVFGGILWFISRYTFGGEHIDEAVESAAEAADTVESMKPGDDSDEDEGDEKESEGA